MSSPARPSPARRPSLWRPRSRCWPAWRCARAAASWASDTAAARGAADVRLALRTALTSKLLALGPRFAASERTGELVGTLGAGVESTDAYVARYQPQFALSFLVPLLVGAAVLRADLLSGLVLAATSPLIPLFMYLIGGVARRRSQAQWVALSRMSARFLDTVQGIATLVTLGRAGDEAAVVASTSERFRVVTMEVLKVAFLSALTLEWLATLGTAVVAVELGLRLLVSRVSFEAALFILVVTPEFYRPLRALGAAFHAAMTGREAGERMSDLLDRRPEPQAAASVTEPRLDVDFVSRAGLALDDVSFRYSPDRPAALDRVSFSHRAGHDRRPARAERLGEIDDRPSRPPVHGAGCRAVCSPAVNPLAALDADAWRRQVAWLPQRPHLFHGSVLDNLRLARPDASDSDIERAIVLAHADQFVRGLPGGLLRRDWRGAGRGCPAARLSVSPWRGRS